MSEGRKVWVLFNAENAKCVRLVFGSSVEVAMFLLEHPGWAVEGEATTLDLAMAYDAKKKIEVVDPIWTDKENEDFVNGFKRLLAEALLES